MGCLIADMCCFLECHTTQSGKNLPNYSAENGSNGSRRLHPNNG